MEKKVYQYLQRIDTPDDLKKIDKTELVHVCNDLRQYIIDEVSQNPGHLGSNLGVVELTVALHYVFNTPYDRLVWDVGHQAYGHKILTGRRDSFSTNRQFKGISGFPTPNESEYDAFGVGHSSTSISAALGISVAATQKFENDKHVVAIIGDGSMTGGLAFEGLNNVSMLQNNILIVLNDNQMAIDPLQGGFTQYLVDILTSPTYNNIRFKASNLWRKWNILNDDGKKRIIQFNNTIKAALTRQTNIFEGLNIRYFGPVDGHDVEALVRILNDIKNFSGPKVLHCITKKGKGYQPAETSDTGWHAPGKFDIETGEIKTHIQEPAYPLFQEVFGETLLELARENEKILAVTPAMPSGCCMNIMQKEFPKRVFDVGIAEGHAVTFSAGLAKEGMIPFCNIYSSFMQRAYDSVIHDVALQKLQVVLCLDRAGIVGSDGATHQGQFDLAYMRCIPNITIAAPRDEIELRHLMFTAQQPNQGAFVIRYPRGRAFTTNWKQTMQSLPIGKGECLKQGEVLAIITIGTMAKATQQAIERIENEQQISIAHYDAKFLKPIDEDMLHEICNNFRHIMTIEDGILQGGFGSAVLEFIADNGYTIPVKRLGIPDIFVEHGTISELHNMLGIDKEGIYRAIKKIIETESVQKTPK